MSPYGLFAVMTTTRNEIIVEGSDDGVQWREYDFRYKPGERHAPSPMEHPSSASTRWQMWLAALDDAQRVTWFSRFLERLLENEPSVTGFFERNAFRDRPPTYVRAEFYEYTYDGNDHEAGQWWDRRLAELYFPKARLKANGE